MRNKYVPGNIGINPQADRLIQNLYERVEFLTDENQRIRELISSSFDMKAKKENPVEGMVTIPAPAGDGFVRVNKDGTIVSYGNPVRSGYCDPIFLGETEAAITSSSETNLRMVAFPPGLHQNKSHLNIEAGGFCLTTGGNVTAFTPTIRYGAAGATSSPICFTNTFIPNGSVVVWFGQFVLSHEISLSGGPDYIGIGGIMSVVGSIKDYAITRGEINMDFSANNFLYFNAAITGTGSDQFVVNETFQVIKYLCVR